MRRYHLHPDAARLPLPCRHHGLVQPQGTGLAAVEHHGRGLLLDALQEATACFGRSAIFNTDQGSQFTSPRFAEVLVEAGVRISMDGRWRWLDDVFIERLWRSLKYECIYLNAFETGSEARTLPLLANPD
ncbi:transposase InsO family protein [Xanthobacter sp. SG618]|nr:transposase InsO family protein [Xanthobacter sp. SG618]